MLPETILDIHSLLSFFVVLFCTFLWIRSRRPSDLPPGPNPLPILGNIFSLKIAGGDLRKVCEKYSAEYGRIFSLSLGSHWVIFVNGLEAQKEVFVKNAEYFSDRPKVFFLTHIKANKGIAAAHPWKEQRAFTLNLLRGFGFGKKSIEFLITEECNYFLDYISHVNTKDKQESFLIGTVNKAISNIICTIVFGKRFGYDDQEFSTFVHATTQIVINEYVPLANLLPFLRFVPGDPLKIHQCTEANEIIRKGFQGYIDDHAATLDENNIRDFIDAYLVEIKKRKSQKTLFTEENLKYVLLDLFSAGTETTSITIMWACLYLVNYPDIQNKMKKEIKDRLDDRRPVVSDRNELPYCEAVIAEVLRISSIVPMSLPHTSSDDVKVNGFRIPKGAIVMPNLYSVNYDEKKFQNPSTFDPTRFLNDDGCFRGQLNSLPFSLGRRTCLGESMAKLELFLFLTSIVHRYKILPVENEPTPPIKGRLGVLHEPMPFDVKFVEYE